MACQAREAKRKFRISDKGSEAMICIKSSLGRAKNSWSNGALDLGERGYLSKGGANVKLVDRGSRTT